MKNPFIHIYFLLFLCSIIPYSTLAQATEKAIYLIGNAAGTDKEWVDLLIEEIDKNDFPSSVYLLGDITDKDGIHHKPKSKNEKRLKRYKQIEKKTKAKVYFLSGDRDWDNSGKSGKKKVNHLEKFIEKDLKLKKRFIPSFACPGPHLIKENDNLLVVAINSQWFIHPYDRPEAPDTECPIIFEADFWEEFEDILDEAKDKNILVLAHHPIYSFSQHNGKKLGLKHLIPFYGSFYASYKQNIGKPTDLAYPRYLHYVDKMRSLINEHNGIIYASGHDYYNSILAHNQNIFITSSISKKNRKWENDEDLIFASKQPSIIKLSYDSQGNISSKILEVKNGEIATYDRILFSPIENNKRAIFNNQRLNKEENNYIYERRFSNLKDRVQIIAGSEYKANPFMRKWMGKNYRNEWTKKISAPILDISKMHGGLKPYARGGGLQTNSLKFKGGDGQNYVFRAVDKNPERALDELLSQTIYRKITKQLITTQHPYGGLVAAELLKATDILHATPTLYVMPDDPQLGPYREAFANVLGFLEIKPKTLKKKRGKTFADADAIVSTHQMLRAMNNDHKHRMDPLAYAKARVFDMWIGDWDKHEDNWKWAMYKSGSLHIYKPIPRDRDHVFSKWEGIIPKLSDQFVPNAENFGHHFGNLTQLNYKACNLDRRFGVEITNDLWKEAAIYIQSKMSENVIDLSLQKLPPELNKDRTIEIKEKLLSRKKELPKMIIDYLDILKNEVTVLGSNKKEYFEIYRLPDGQVEVSIYPLSSKGKIKDQIYQQSYYLEKTKTIYIYGLGGQDEFVIRGEVDNSIKIRIIPGGGKDNITDLSQVKGSSKLSQIYQGKKEKDIISKSSETAVKRPFHQATYDYHNYHLDALLPFLSVQFSGYSGIGFSLDVKKTKQGFNKPDFAKIHHFKLKYYPKVNAYRAQYQYMFRHLIRDWDFKTKHLISDQLDKYPFFFGLGSNTTVNDELQDQNYYRIDFDTYRAKFGLEKDFLFKSDMGIFLNYEYNEVSSLDDSQSLLDDPVFNDLQGKGKNHSFDIESHLTLDFRDHQISSYQGSLLHLKHRLYYSFNNQKLGGHIDFNMSHYETIKILLPITFIGRIGSLNTYGSLPFYQRSILGSNTYLRGYDRNRFIGNHAAYLNLESRIQIDTWYNLLAPITYGIFGFYDQGTVWNDFSEFSDQAINWRTTIGLGIFAAPLSRDFTFSMSYARNDEKRGYFELGLGFDLDRDY